MLVAAAPRLSDICTPEEIHLGQENLWRAAPGSRLGLLQKSLFCCAFCSSIVHWVVPLSPAGSHVIFFVAGGWGNPRRVCFVCAVLILNAS